MEQDRVEAFSDGVIAVIITIMVLELKVPHGADFAALAPLWPVFLSYVLSFVYIGIYWSNHHHMLKLVRSVNGAVLLLCAVAYTALQRAIIALQGAHSRLKEAIGNDAKGYASLAMYATAIPLAFVNRWLAYAIYVSVALVWFIPDRRIEKRLT